MSNRVRHNSFIHNNVIPFVGAGFSKNADIPEGLAMPEWNELGKKVASEIPDYKYENNALVYCIIDI